MPQLGFISALVRLAALSPLSLAACGTLIGLDDLERAECEDACLDGQVEPGAPTSGSAPVEQGGGGAQLTGGGTLGVAGGGTLGVSWGGAPSSGAGGMRNGDAGGAADNTPYGYGGAGSGAGTATAGGSGGNGDVGGGGSSGSGGTNVGGTAPATGGSTGGLPIRINFQPLAAPVPAGYVPDTGLKFAAQGDLSFGWNVDHTDVTRDREVNSNQLLDTLCQFHEGGVWELALPNGTYSVLVSVGDARLLSTYTLVVEGVTYWEKRVIGANQFVSNTSDISIADGRLTLDQGTAGELATRINYIEVSRL